MALTKVSRGLLSTGIVDNSTTTAITIDSSENVGIGTSSPVSFGANTAGLTVNGSSGSHITWQNNGTNVAFAYPSGNNFIIGSEQAGSNTIFTAAGAERMRLSGGNLLVGTTTSRGRITANGADGVAAIGTTVNAAINYNAVSFHNNAGTQVGRILANNAGTTQYITSSDQRLKTGVADADDAGSKIDSIQVRKFDWIADGSHQDYGMIAQELQVVAPEAVAGDADSEEIMGVDYSKLVPMLVKEIQSLRSRVAELENN